MRVIAPPMASAHKHKQISGLVRSNWEGMLTRITTLTSYTFKYNKHVYKDQEPAKTCVHVR